LSEAALQEWLELGRQFLALSDDECLTASEAFVARRQILMEQLHGQREGAAGCVGSALAEQLREQEPLLECRFGALLEKFRVQLSDARRTHLATAGYRPARESIPAFVSRQV